MSVLRQTDRDLFILVFDYRHTLENREWRRNGGVNGGELNRMHLRVRRARERLVDDDDEQRDEQEKRERRCVNHRDWRERYD